MRISALGVLLLTALLAGLPPLADASPPDQSWLPGLYDNGDYDDAIIALTSAVVLTDEAPVPERRPDPAPRWLAPETRPSPPASPVSSSYRLRAPPLA